MASSAQARNIKNTKTKAFPVLSLVLGGVIILSALLVWGFIFLFWGYFQVSERILPGVQAAGVNIGGLTRKEAEAAIDLKWNSNKQVLVGSGDVWWRTSSLSLGLFVDSNSIVEEAYQTGRGTGGLMGWISNWFAPVLSTQPEILFNEEMARSTLKQINDMVFVAPQIGSIVFENGQWIAKDGISGRGLDIEKAIMDLRDHRATILNQARFELSFNEIKSDSLANSEVLTKLNQIGNKPIIAEVYSPFNGEFTNHQIGMETIVQYLQWDAQSQSLLMNEQAVLDLIINQITANTGQKVRFDGDLYQVREDWENQTKIPFSVVEDPKNYVVQSGDTLLKISMRFEMPYWYILQANPGLDQNRLSAGQEITIPSRNELLPLPYIRSKRIVISIQEQRMRVYENGQQIQEYVVSTGIATSPTLPGIYQVRTHELSAYASNWDLTMPHFLGIYEAWPGFMNGIHGLPTLSNGRILWGNVLGGPASYGCIILSLENGEALYNWAENGVVVEIVN